MANVTSSIKLRRATGSITDVPSSLSEGEFAINLLSGKLYYGTRFGFDVSSSFEFDTFTASYISVSNTLTTRDLTVTNTASIKHIQYLTSSVIQASGSTFFGDSIDDVHVRTGSMFISGGLVMAPNTHITASVITASHLFVSGVDNRTSPGGTPTQGSGYLKSGSLYADGPIRFHNSLLGSASVFTTQSSAAAPTVFVVSGNLVVEDNAHDGGSGGATINTTTISSSFISASIISASEYFGVTKTQYQTGSTTEEDLLNLKILNFDSNVFVTSDPVTGQLTLQFGEASLPVVSISASGGTFAQPTDDGSPSTVVVSTDYVTNRFNLQSQSSFIFSASIGDIPDSVTILSCSLLVNDVNTINLEYRSGSDAGFPENAGTFVYEVTAPNSFIGTSQPNEATAGGNGQIKCSAVGSGVVVKTNNNHLGLTTGSGYTVTSRWTVRDGTGTVQTVTASYEFATSKGNPTQNITITPLYTGLEGSSEFVSSSGTTTFIENGITGSISYTTNSMANYSNLWVFTGTSATQTNPFDVEVTQSGNTTLTVTANYTSVGSPGTSSYIDVPLIDANLNAFAKISSGSNDPNSTPTRTSTRTYKRVTSIRTFCSPTASFTEQQLWDIKGAWTSSVFSASIGFESTPNPNGHTFVQPIPAEAAYPAGLYSYIIYSASFGDITALSQNSSPALGNWSKIADYPTYKVYRTNNLQSSDSPGSTFVITI